MKMMSTVFTTVVMYVLFENESKPPRYRERAIYQVHDRVIVSYKSEST